MLDLLSLLALAFILSVLIICAVEYPLSLRRERAEWIAHMRCLSEQQRAQQQWLKEWAAQLDAQNARRPSKEC